MSTATASLHLLDTSRTFCLSKKGPPGPSRGLHEAKIHHALLLVFHDKGKLIQYVWKKKTLIRSIWLCLDGAHASKVYTSMCSIERRYTFVSLTRTKCLVILCPWEIKKRTKILCVELWDDSVGSVLQAIQFTQSIAQLSDMLSLSVSLWRVYCSIFNLNIFGQNQTIREITMDSDRLWWTYLTIFQQFIDKRWIKKIIDGLINH